MKNYKWPTQLQRNIPIGDKKFLTESEMDAIKQKKWDAVEVTKNIPEGSGLFAAKHIPEKATLCDYGGTRLTGKEADELPGETPYLFEFKDPTTHRVIYIDNEHLPDEIGHYINHSSIHPNCKPVVKKCPITKDIHVVFVSTRPITAGDQIVWDYGVQYGMEHDCVQSCSKCAETKQNTPKKKCTDGRFTRSRQAQPEVRVTRSAANKIN